MGSDQMVLDSYSKINKWSFFWKGHWRGTSQQASDDIIKYWENDKE